MKSEADPDMEQVDYWANYVRTHKDWKRIHTKFIDAQFDKHRQFVRRLEKTPGGKKKLRRLFLEPKK